MIPRRLLSASAITLLMAVILAIPADAQRGDRDRDRGRESDREQTEPRCKSELIKASGNAVWRPFSRDREIDGRGAAMQNAIANWQRQVRAKYGETWMEWGKSEEPQQGRDLRKECKAASIGTFGRNIIRCTISGHPCKEVLDPSSVRREEQGSGGCRYREHHVSEAQRLLNACDSRCDIKIDGLLGQQTRDCLERFQRRNSLQRTGEPCPETLNVLRRSCGGRYRGER